MTLPLDGIKVIDLSRMAPGPFCTMVLSDLGADVLKVEEFALSGRRAAVKGCYGGGWVAEPFRGRERLRPHGAGEAQYRSEPQE